MKNEKEFLEEFSKSIKKLRKLKKYKMEDFSFNDVDIVTQTGKAIKENKEEYFKEREIKDITFHEKLEVGDTVKLKLEPKLVTVKYVDFEIPNLGKVDYAGVKEDDTSYLVLFNQKDIDIKPQKEKVR